jgi:hypothetical protein
VKPQQTTTFSWEKESISRRLMGNKTMDLTQNEKALRWNYQSAFCFTEKVNDYST